MNKRFKYDISLYNKDADAWLTVHRTNKLEVAEAVAEALKELVLKDMIIDRTSVYTEPFDLVEIYDSENQSSIEV